MKRPWDRVLIWLKRINANFLPIEVSESDFRQWRENSPLIEPAETTRDTTVYDAGGMG